jgi:cytidine deaminase
MNEEERRSLLQRAREAAKAAYVPYSNFPVGAALLTEDGAVISGCNVENASYGLTICAERSAAVAAVGAGHRAFRAVAVSAPRSRLATPCGACRQFLNEFRPLTGELTVILDDGETGLEIPFSELLPRAFGPRDLEPGTEGLPQHAE